MLTLRIVSPCSSPSLFVRLSNYFSSFQQAASLQAARYLPETKVKKFNVAGILKNFLCPIAEEPSFEVWICWRC
jgi:hypothetical protein